MSAHFTILLIEDETVDSQVNRIMLEHELFEIIAVNDATQAWNIMHDTLSVDLIVLNLNVRDKQHFNIDANKILDALQKDELWKQVPLILITDKRSSQGQLEQDFIKSTDLIILSPFDPVLFIASAYRAIAVNVSRHINSVNAQHVNLARQLNSLQQAIQRSPRVTNIHLQLLKNIYRSIEQHFAFEETFMQTHRFAETTEHRDHHSQILESVNSMMGDPHGQLIRENLQTLKHSLLDSDNNHDRRYIEFLQSTAGRLDIDLNLLQF